MGWEIGLSLGGETHGKFRIPTFLHGRARRDRRSHRRYVAGRMNLRQRATRGVHCATLPARPRTYPPPRSRSSYRRASNVRFYRSVNVLRSMLVSVFVAIMFSYHYKERPQNNHGNDTSAGSKYQIGTAN